MREHTLSRGDYAHRKALAATSLDLIENRMDREDIHMNRKGLILVLTIVGMLGAFRNGLAQPAQPTRSIANVSGNLWRAQNNTHFTVFLVTAEGIIVSDPISRDFATWFKSELDERFGLPVRYLLYSHSDAGPRFGRGRSLRTRHSSLGMRTCARAFRPRFILPPCSTPTGTV